MEGNPKYISLLEASRFCKYSQEYLSLRVRQGKLKGVKFGRNWATTREWLDDYMATIVQYSLDNSKRVVRRGDILQSNALHNISHESDPNGVTVDIAVSDKEQEDKIVVSDSKVNEDKYEVKNEDFCKERIRESLSRLQKEFPVQFTSHSTLKNEEGLPKHQDIRISEDIYKFEGVSVDPKIDIGGTLTEEDFGNLPGCRIDDKSDNVKGDSLKKFWFDDTPTVNSKLRGFALLSNIFSGRYKRAFAVLVFLLFGYFVAHASPPVAAVMGTIDYFVSDSADAQIEYTLNLFDGVFESIKQTGNDFSLFSEKIGNVSDIGYRKSFIAIREVYDKLPSLYESVNKAITNIPYFFVDTVEIIKDVAKKEIYALKEDFEDFRSYLEKVEGRGGIQFSVLDAKKSVKISRNEIYNVITGISDKLSDIDVSSFEKSYFYSSLTSQIKNVFDPQNIQGFFEQTKQKLSQVNFALSETIARAIIEDGMYVLSDVLSNTSPSQISASVGDFGDKALQTFKLKFYQFNDNISQTIARAYVNTISFLFPGNPAIKDDLAELNLLKVKTELLKQQLATYRPEGTISQESQGKEDQTYHSPTTIDRTVTQYIQDPSLKEQLLTFNSQLSTQLEATQQILSRHLVSLESDILQVNTRLASISDSQYQLTSPRLYQQSNDLTLGTYSGGAINISATQGLNLTGANIIIDANPSTSSTGAPPAGLITLRDNTWVQGTLTVGTSTTVISQDQITINSTSTANPPLIINTPATFAGNLIEARVGGVNKYTVNQAGNLDVAGQFTTQDGTASNPAISFTSDTNTGLYRPTTDSIAITTGGSERVRVNASGDVGINYTDPASGSFAINKNVGIGTTAPQSALHVAQNAAVTEIARFHAATSGGKLLIGRTDSPASNSIQLSSVEEPGSGLAFATRTLANSTTIKMVINSEGLVGIGTTAPTSLLHINDPSITASGGSDATYFSARSPEGGDLFLGRTNIPSVDSIFFASQERPNVGFTFRTRDSGGVTTDRVVITGAGNVGIGYTDPNTSSGKLTVNGNVGIGVTNPISSLSVGADNTIRFTVTGSTGHVLINPTYGIDTLTAGTLTFGDATATQISIGTQSTTRTINIGTGTQEDTVNIGTGATTSNIVNIATGAVSNTTTIGTTAASSSLTLRSGTGDMTLTTFDAFTLDGVATTNYTIGSSTASGTFTIGGTAQTGDMILGSSSGTNNIILGAGSGTASIGMGTTTPVSKLEISNANSPGTQSILTISNETATNTLDPLIQWRLGSAPSILYTMGVDDSEADTFRILAGTSLTGASGITLDSSNRVGLGTTIPSEQLEINGNLKFTGNTTISTGGTGNFTIDSGGGTITIASGDDILASGSFSNIGSAGTRFDKIYADEVNAVTLVGTIVGGNTSAETFTINSDYTGPDAEDSNLAFERGSETPNALLTWTSAADLFDFNFGARITNTGTTDSFVVFDEASDASPFVINQSGSVGIGTTASTGLLDVNNTTTSTITASANARVLNIQGAFTEATSGTHARIMGVEITPPTITNGGGTETVTDTASLYISAAPTATVTGANYALWVDAGTSRFDGTVQTENAAGYALLNEAASATNPTMVPNVADLDTGIGSAAADQLSLIAGGIEGLRLTEGTAVAGSIAALISAASGTDNTSLTVQNTTNSGASHSIVDIAVGGTTSTGDPQLRLTIPDGVSFYVGNDNSMGDLLSIGSGTVVGTSEYIQLGGTASTNTPGLVLGGVAVGATTGHTGTQQSVRIEARTYTFSDSATATALINMLEVQAHAFAQTNGAVTVDKATGVSSIVPTAGASITLTDGSAYRVLNGATPTGTLTNQYGLYIENLTSGSSDYGIYIAGADTRAIWVDAGDVRFDANLVVGGNTSATETLTDTGFVMGGDDLFVAGMMGVEGAIYTDSAVGAKGTGGHYFGGGTVDSNTLVSLVQDYTGASGNRTLLRVGNSSNLNLSAGGAEALESLAYFDIRNITQPDGIATTITAAATVYIEGAHTVDGSGGGTPTVSNNYALFVDAGTSRFDSSVGIGYTDPDTAVTTLAVNGEVGIGTTNPTAVFDVLPAAASISAEKILSQVGTGTLTIGTTFTNQRMSIFNAPTLSIDAGRTVTNAATAYISGAPTNSGAGILSNPYALWVDAGTSRFDGSILINDDVANGEMTTGLTISQGAADNEILALKSSDVAHGATAITETDTYMAVLKHDAVGGGVQFEAISDANQTQNETLQFAAYSGVAANSTKTTSGSGVVQIYAGLVSGTGSADVAADGNLFAISNRATTRFIVDAEGDIHLPQATTISTTANDLTLSPAGNLILKNGLNFIGDTANSKMTQGLTINQGANDNEIIALKSSDIAHGITNMAETDTYGTLEKHHATGGGLKITGFGMNYVGTAITGFGTNDNTTKTGSADGYITISAQKANGIGIQNPGANANIISIQSGGSGAGLIIDAESTIHQIPGSDIDIDLLTVQVTGTPTLMWDESEDQFSISKGLDITTGSLAFGTVGSEIYTIASTGLITVAPSTTGTLMDYALETEWTFGTLMNADFAGATTQGAATITGISLNLNTNLTTPAAGQNVTGIALQLPVASTTSLAAVYAGIDLSATGAVTNATAGSFAWRGANIVLPVITQSAGGSVTASGFRVLIPASGAIVTAGTMNAIDVIAPTTSGPVAGTLVGVNIANLTSAGAGTETAVSIGSGWDTDLAFVDTTPTVTIGNTGTLTVTDGTNTLFSIADDTSEGDVTITGDLAVNGATAADITSTTTTANVFNATVTTLSLGGAATALNLGDAATTLTIDIGGVTADGTTTVNIATNATSADTIAIGNTHASTATTITGDVNIAVTDGDTVNIDGDGSPTADILTIGSGDTSATDGVDALQITFTGSNASGNVIDITPAYSTNVADTYNVIDIDAFTATADDSVVGAGGNTATVRAINIGALTQSELNGEVVTATALNIGATWDTDINATTSLEIGIGGTNELTLTATDFSPSTSDGNALGTGSLMWSDLFLASGAVINFNNGAETITHSANTLSVGGTYNLTLEAANTTNNTTLKVSNTSNTAATAEHAIVDIAVGGTTTTGDPQLRFTVPSGTSYYIGADNDDFDILKIGLGTAVGTTALVHLNGATTLGDNGYIPQFQIRSLSKTITGAADATLSHIDVQVVGRTHTYDNTAQRTGLQSLVSIGVLTIAHSGVGMTVDKAAGLSSVGVTAGALVTLTHSSAFRALTGGAAVNVSGLYVENEATNATTAGYGIYIENQTGGAGSEYGLYIAGADTNAIWVDAGTVRFDDALIFGADGTAPAGTNVYAVRDNTGDLTLNALTGKTINLAINGTDVAQMSATALAFQQATTVSTTTGALNLTSTDGAINVTLGGGAADDFIVDTTTLVVESDNDRVGIGLTAPLTKLDIAGSSRTTGTATSVLTGSIDPTASTAVVGVNTLFTTQLIVGDRITVTGETRAVTAITDDTNLTVSIAFSDNANDTSPDRLPAIATWRDSANATVWAIDSVGALAMTSGAVLWTMQPGTLQSQPSITFNNSNSVGVGGQSFSISGTGSTMYFGTANVGNWVIGLGGAASGLSLATGSNIFNDVSGDNDFRIESDNNANIFLVDAGTESMNIGGSGVVAGAFLNISGATNARTLITSVGAEVHHPAATFTDNGGARTVAIGAREFYGIPTLTNASNAVTFTDAATLYIAGAPVAGTNVTIPSAYALWVDAGTSRFDTSQTIASAAGSTLNAFTIPADTITLTGSTNITTATGFNLVNIGQPSFADNDAGTITITNAATMYIANAPTGTGTTPPSITNPYALWVDAGNVRFDGGLTVSDDTLIGTAHTGDANRLTISEDTLTTTSEANAIMALQGNTDKFIVFHEDGVLGGAIGYQHLPTNSIQIIPPSGTGSLPSYTMRVRSVDAVVVDASDSSIELAPQLAEAASGTHAILDGVKVSALTITAGVAAVTEASTMRIVAAPSVAGATNYALWVDAGTSRFDGAIAFGDETVDIGTSTVGLNDLHFGSGGIINFDGGNVTITHSAGKLTLNDTTVNVGGSGALQLGSANVQIAHSASGIVFTADGVNRLILNGETSGVIHDIMSRTISSTTTEVIHSRVNTRSINLPDATTIATFRKVSIAQDTFVGNAGVGVETITDAATFYITGAPINGGNLTLTNPYALFVDAGTSRFDTSQTVASAAGATLNAFTIPADTITLTGSTNITTATGFNLINIGQPSFADNDAGTIAITNAATMYIANAPAGTGTTPPTITNPYALWVDAGTVRFDDALILGADGTAPAGTNVYAVRDNTGDLTLNALTGKTINLAINGTDVAQMSATSLAFQQATTVSTTTGNLTLYAATDQDVLIGDGAALLNVDGGVPGIFFNRNYVEQTNAGDVSGGQTYLGSTWGRTFTATAGIPAAQFRITGNMTANAGNEGYGLLLQPTLTEAGSGNHAFLANLYIDQVTPVVGVATVTNTASLYIKDAMSATVSGANYALFVDAGTSRFDTSQTIASAAGSTLNAFTIPADTITLTGSTNITTATGFNLINIGQPSFADNDAGTIAITNAATMYIANAPAGTGTTPPTITNPYALWVDDGVSRFDASVQADILDNQTEDGAVCITSGNVFSDETDSVCDASSITVKDDVVNLNYGFAELMQLRPVTFRYKQSFKPDFQIARAGFIAEEMDLVIPEVVTYSSYDANGFVNGVPDGIDYGKLTSFTVKVLQDMNKIIDLSLASTASPSITIDVDGNIGIGTTSPEYKLHVAGDIAATSFVNISTSHSKKDISHITQEKRESLLASISSIPVSTYKYLDEEETDPLRLGLIAEESPEYILSADGKGVDLYKLATTILVGLQEQQKQITELKASIDLLKLGFNIESAVQFGLINLPGNIEAWDMKGKTLAYAQGIISSLGTWSIDEEGKLVVKKIETERIEVKKPYGITIYDVETGEPICVVSKNRVLQSIPGKCEDVELQQSAAPQPQAAPTPETQPTQEQFQQEPQTESTTSASASAADLSAEASAQAEAVASEETSAGTVPLSLEALEGQGTLTPELLPADNTTEPASVESSGEATPVPEPQIEANVSP